ncbi:MULTISPECIES: ATP-dependent DNA helicase RecG [unclassified Minwuia]|jgi:ATP-dependent DNA helicase RecG|uniref:ATP-dependent DNA helicase RecG n=1 Tax=unclassified Minwuia TaxID=2618799 RepID=UPI00247ACEB2|nr:MULTISPECIES: ATP-dependent DNA helicase RecG [unclassified Minwuia]
MRPEVLFPLFAPVNTLKGVGPRVAALLEKLEVTRILDLLWLLPHSHIDRSLRPNVEDALPGETVTLTLNILEHQPGRTDRQPYRIFAGDETGVIGLTFFRPRRDWLERQFPPGERRIVSGKLERYGDQFQMVHPEHVADPDKGEDVPLREPVYPLTAGLAPKSLRNAVVQAVERAPEISEWQDAAFRAKNRFPDWQSALRTVHSDGAAAPVGADTDGDPDLLARRRLAYDELLANQLALALVRQRMRRQGGRGLAVHPDGRMTQLRASLPWPLTGAQDRVIAEIIKDLQAPTRMLRLLQGDVGSGKTAVALLVATAVVEAGSQVALMVPTEVLARQHARTLTEMGAAIGLRVEALTGRDKGKARTAILQRLDAGEIDLVVGTHALFQDAIRFRDLGLAIIDEQHRFGVHQRMLLSAKARRTSDVLVMTATPIPRTLAMTAYGDMDVSRLDERPPGRKPVDTRVLPTDRAGAVVERLRGLMGRGERAYWICPLVDDESESEAAAAEARFRELQQQFGDRVGLVHGRLKPEEKDAALVAFADGKTSLLVATTVVEVGVDVPEATVIVIEDAERFGLAQLHQLRGRVGRGDRPGHCLLLYRPPLGETARKRLEVLRDTDDGFLIAEEDFRLRGGGDLLGTRQSGLPPMKLARVERDQDLLAAAHDDARLIVNNDPELQGKRGPDLRTLLYLFERDAAIRYLKSG